MQITRGGFLTMTGAVGGGVALSSLGLNLNPARAYADELGKMNRIKAARQVSIEGDADHPINEGSLCAKGAGFFDLTEANRHRLTKVLYRNPYGTEWEEKDWDFVLSRIARLVKDTRDKNFVKRNAKGELVDRCEAIGHYGSSNVDNEECWLMSVKSRALGLVYIDHQARV